MTFHDYKDLYAAALERLCEEHTEAELDDLKREAESNVMSEPKWTHRIYEVDCSADDYLRLQKQMKEQDEKKDDIILLTVSYKIQIGKATIER